MRKNLWIIISLLLFVYTNVQANQVSNEYCWYDGGSHISYSLSKIVSPVVATAIGMWSEDMNDVTGATLLRVGNGAKVRIVQLDKDKSAAKILKAAEIDVDELIKKKDAFCIKVYDNQLMVVGSDGRGTAYGILELSRLAGVSPWKWWADEKPDRRNRLALPTDFHTMQSPSVEYRGIFINDEDWTIQPWSWRTFSPGKAGLISAKTYKQIFKLLMRLRANAVWPAMHGSST
ncbi:MAG: glycosyl hydrolase 115 family protein, partial [Prevotella sp.]